MKLLNRLITISFLVLFISITTLLFEGCGSCYDCSKEDFRPPQEHLGKLINSGADDFSPLMIKDNTLVFTSNRGGGSNKKITKSNKLGEDLFTAVYKDGAWQKAILQPNTITSDKNEGTPAVSGVVVARTYDDKGLGGSDLYNASVENNIFTILDNLGANINSIYWDGHPALSTDGQMLIFVSDRPGGKGGTDLYMSRKTSSGWSKAVNMSELNTQGNEYSPFISPDNTTLFFASDGRNTGDKLDIFVTGLNDNKKVKNIGSPFNSTGNDFFPFLKKNSCNAPGFDPNEKDTLFFSSDREDGCGGYDLYAAPYVTPKIILAGTVRDSKTREPLKVNSTLEIVPGNLSTGIFMDVEAPQSKFEKQICTGKYTLKAKAEGYFPAEAGILADFSVDEQKIEKDIYLIPHPSVIIAGLVEDNCGPLPCECEVVLINKEDKSEVQKVTTVNSKYEFKLPYSEKAMSYEIKIGGFDYIPVTEAVVEVPPALQDAKYEKNLLVELAPVNPATIPYFVTGFYMLNTPENLEYLKSKWAGKYQKLGYIERPTNKIAGRSYEEYAEEVLEFTGIVKTKILDTLLPRLDQLLASSPAAKLHIDFEGYVDEREFFGTYPDERAVVDNGVVARNDNISNFRLSMLRAYYTHKYFMNMLSSASDKFAQYVKEGKIISRKVGKGVPERGLNKRDPETNLLYATHRHIKIFTYISCVDGRDCEKKLKKEVKIKPKAIKKNQKLN